MQPAMNLGENSTDVMTLRHRHRLCKKAESSVRIDWKTVVIVVRRQVWKRVWCL